MLLLRKRNKLFSTNGNSSVDRNIINIFGAKQISNLQPLSLEFEISRKSLYSRSKASNSSSIQVKGFISNPTPGNGRSSPDRQLVYVNNRPCLSPAVSKCFNECYRQFNPTQYPFFVADICVDRASVDINVTPDKRTVLLHDEVLLIESLRDELLACLSESISSVSSKAQSTLVDVISGSPPMSSSSMHNYRDTFETASANTSVPIMNIVSEPDSEKTFAKKVSSYLDGRSTASLRPNQGKATSNETAQSSAHEQEQTRKRKLESESTTTKEGSDQFETGRFQRFSRSSTLNKRPSDEKLERISDSAKDNSEIINSKPVKRTRSTSRAESIPKSLIRSSDAVYEVKISDEEKEKEQRDETSSEDDEPVVTAHILGKESNRDAADSDEIAATNARMEIGNLLQTTENDRQLTRSNAHSTHNYLLKLDVSLADIKSQNQILRLNKSPTIKQTDESLQMEINQGEEHLQALNISKSDFSKMSIIGQFNLGFIIAFRSGCLSSEDQNHGDDLFIIDQHASDEKFNFERLQREVSIAKQPLVV